MSYIDVILMSIYAIIMALSNFTGKMSGAELVHFFYRLFRKNRMIFSPIKDDKIEPKLSVPDF